MSSSPRPVSIDPILDADKSFDRTFRYRRMLSAEFRLVLAELRILSTDKVIRQLAYNEGMRVPPARAIPRACRTR